jgi:hypothetical protein
MDSYFFFSNEEYAAMVRANGRLVSRCMARFGVAYESEVADDDLVPGVNFIDTSRLNARRYGLFDRDSASIRGYHNAHRPAVDQPKRDGRIHTEGELLLLFGKTRPEYANVASPIDLSGAPLPDDGCTGEAERIVTGDRTQAVDINEVSARAFRQAETDSRTRAAIGAWSECMRTSGYDYTSVWEPGSTQWPDPPGEEEITTAVRDVSCKLETNLVGIWFAVESAYQRRLIEEHAQAFAAQREYRQTVLRNSARILGEG